MIDYKTFKKGYLNEWVDQSQAARRAAEELAKKEVRPSLRDLYKPEGLIFDFDDRRVEFKGENEKKSNGDIYFTWVEAMDCFGEPNRDGWRLPTKREFEMLKDCYPYEFKGEQGGVFDKRLILPASGFCACDGIVNFVGSTGDYWSSTPTGSDGAYYLGVYLKGAVVIIDYRCYGHTVRLVRDVN